METPSAVMNDYEAGKQAERYEEIALKHAQHFAKHLGQDPCDTDRVKLRIQSYLQGLGGDQDVWDSPQALYLGGEVSLWLLISMLDFSRNIKNIDFVLQGLAAQQTTDSGSTSASALYTWANERALFTPMTDHRKGIFRTTPEEYYPDRGFLGASIAAARLKSLGITGSINFKHVLNQGLGIPHTFCDEQAEEDEWNEADRDDWIAGACLQLLGSWRRHRVFILGQDDLNEAQVKLTPPATRREYNWHEYMLYLFPPSNEEERRTKSETVQAHLDALSRLHVEVTSCDVKSLVGYTQKHVSDGKPDMTSAELDRLCRQILQNWEHQLDVVL